MKIELLNPTAGQTLSAKDTVSKAQPTTASQVPSLTSSTDTLNLSIPPHVSGEKLSSLLSDLIKILNMFENPPDSTRPGINPFVKGELLNNPTLEKGRKGGFVESLFYKDEEPLSFLKSFIEKSGLLYEAKISRGDIKGLEDDLKGLLLKVIEKQGEKTEAGKIANTLLNDIEAKQLLNAKGKKEGVFHLQIPVLLPQGATTAEVQVRRDGKGKGEYMGDSHRIGFSIELRDAGLVSIDAQVLRNYVSIRFQVEKAEFLEYMKFHLPELSERLSGYGMTASLERVGTNG